MIRQQVTPYTKAAALVGLDKPIVVAGTAPPAAPTSFPIKTSPQTKLTGLSLSAAIDTPEAVAAKATSPMFAYARYACWGLAGLLLIMFGVSRARRD